MLSEIRAARELFFLLRNLPDFHLSFHTISSQLWKILMWTIAFSRLGNGHRRPFQNVPAPAHGGHKCPLCLTPLHTPFGVSLLVRTFTIYSCAFPEGFPLQWPRRWAGLWADIFVGWINAWIQAAMGTPLPSRGWTLWTPAIAWHPRYTLGKNRGRTTWGRWICPAFNGNYFQRFLGERAFPSASVLPPPCDAIGIQAAQFSPLVSTRSSKVCSWVRAARELFSPKEMHTMT